MNLDIISFLKDGKYRLDLLKDIKESPKLPSEIAKKFQLNRASVSRILRDLKNKNLIIPHSEKSRTIIYSITKSGEEVLGRIK